MNLEEIRSKLIQAAREHPASAAVPAGFERRIMKRISTLDVADRWAEWAAALWRAAAPCVGVAVVLATWVMLSAPANSANSDVSQEFENTVLAAATLDQTPADSLR